MALLFINQNSRLRLLRSRALLHKSFKTLLRSRHFETSKIYAIPAIPPTPCHIRDAPISIPIFSYYIYLNSVITMQGLWKVGSITAVRAQLQDEDERKNLMQSAAELGKRMAAAIKNRETFPEQEEDRNQAFEIMKFMVMMLQDEWPFAWNYWNTHWNMAEAS